MKQNLSKEATNCSSQCFKIVLTAMQMILGGLGGGLGMGMELHE